MFGMGLTIHIGDFKVVFTRPKEIIIGFAAQYTIMPLIAWGLSVLLHLPISLRRRIPRRTGISTTFTTEITIPGKDT